MEVLERSLIRTHAWFQFRFKKEKQTNGSVLQRNAGLFINTQSVFVCVSEKSRIPKKS